MRLFQNLTMAAVLAGIAFSAQAAIEDTLSYYDTDDYGNVVYFGSGQQSEYEFIFVDGSKTVALLLHRLLRVLVTAIKRVMRLFPPILLRK